MIPSLGKYNFTSSTGTISRSNYYNLTNTNVPVVHQDTLGGTISLFQYAHGTIPVHAEYEEQVSGQSSQHLYTCIAAAHLI